MFISKQITNLNKLNIIILLLTTFFLLIVSSIYHHLLDSNFTLLGIILLTVFILEMIVSMLWLRDKLSFKSENFLHNSGKVPYWNLILASFYFSGFLVLGYLTIFNWTLNISTELGSNAVILIYGFFLTINNGIVLIHINDIFKPHKRPNGYIFKYINRKVSELSNNFETVFSIKVVFFIIFLIIPVYVCYLLTNDIVATYFISSILLNALAGSYWLGYGLYKYFTWIWGAQINTRLNNQQNLVNTNFLDFIKNLRFSEGQSVFFSFSYILLNILLLFVIFIKTINNTLTIPITALIFFLLVYLIFSVIVILPVTGKRTSSQPWYRISFTMFSFSIPFYIVILAKYLLTTSNSVLLIPETTKFDGITLVMEIIFLLIVLIIFITNNKYLTTYMWKDPYESNQLLSALKISLERPSTIQLNLLQKLSNTLEDKDTIIKLIHSYQILLESPENKEKDALIKSMVNFIHTQLIFTEEDEVFELLFNLTHNLLDEYTKEADGFFESYFNILKTGNSYVKTGALNVLGQILQITSEKSFIEQTYKELEIVYSSPDEKLKRLSLDAFKFFIKNNPEYISRIKSFITQKLEYETFGIATILFSLLDEIYQQDGDKSIYELAKNILSSLDSPGKLGVINFLKNNFPETNTDQKEFIELFFKNLHDVDNAIGVRTNIIYAIDELVKKDSSKNSLLPDLKFLIQDSDPDVKSTLIQIYTEQFLIQNIKFNLVREVFEAGIQEQDYIVRLIVIKSIKAIKANKNELFDELRPIVEKLLEDVSKIILEEARNLLND